MSVEYAFAIDDCVFFLTEIFEKKYESLFDCFFLKKLREFNRNYGTKFVLNIFFRNDHKPDFNIGLFPDTYKDEWIANSDWLRLSFHAFSEFPGLPYKNASPDALRQDIELIETQIIRFAGKKTYSPPAVVHFISIPDDCFSVMKEAGSKYLMFLSPGNYEDESLKAECAQPLFHDEARGLSFIKCAIVINNTPLELVEGKLAEALSWGTEKIHLLTHEQYSFDYYSNYLPDHFDRIETALRFLKNKGIEPIFIQD